MRIAFILTYPLYYDGVPFDQWLSQPCRERRLAGLVAAKGHCVEFWAVGQEDFRLTSTDCGGDFTIRIFKVNRRRRRTKYDASEFLVNHAKNFNADLHILKGVDGGTGTFLIRKYLKIKRGPLAFILGGGYQTRYHSRARIVFYESDMQKKRLMEPGWRFWQTKPAAKALIRLPKWVDDQVFGPQKLEKVWDILIIGRLVRRNKNYDALGVLSKHFRVAVIGDGEDAHRLRTTYPKVKWLGFIPNRELPKYINRAYLLMHTSIRDFFPRVVAEAMTCGVPCAAFAGPIAEDVIPAGCGLLLDRKDYISCLGELLGDKKRLRRMGEQALRHARVNIGKKACEATLKKMFDLLAESPRSVYPGLEDVQK